ncbi:ATP-binding protein [Granulicella sp. dw_53]|uniref:ATP-binding response regulator n=1 Tax=Granulicella sp. dw_53 TaxID=2719792 RepID=UPI001BD3D055|nr:ATP-binding protein [Granulicella sp. dw_53]
MRADKDLVLVVDDRPANRYAVVHALKRAGYEVAEAESGREALELAQQVPSLILLDVKLPDILGYEVCRRLKANPRTSHIPVLQLSAAFVDNESRVYALESGADAYLTQPVEPNVLIATVRSLVKLHEAESLAKLSAKQWQSTFDSLSEGVAIINKSGLIERCNRAMSALLERSHTEIEGHPLFDVLKTALDVELSNEDEAEVSELSSKSRYFRARIEPVFLDAVRTGSIFVLADITRQKIAEHAALMNERLAATGRMAHTIAHEINNPLEAITNLLYLLKGTTFDSKSWVEYLSSAEDEVARVSRITRQILTFHRESALPVEVDLQQLLEDVLALNNRSIVEKKLRVRTEWRSAIVVNGFPAQLRQVFSNILRNAIDASFPEGEIRIKVSSSMIYGANKEPGGRVTIADNGIGIPKQNRDRVFDAFFTTKELKGTGVGLWLSSTIVQQHRGRIQVRSTSESDRSGSCISVILPLRNAASA